MSFEQDERAQLKHLNYCEEELKYNLILNVLPIPIRAIFSNQLCYEYNNIKNTISLYIAMILFLLLDIIAENSNQYFAMFSETHCDKLVRYKTNNILILSLILHMK